MNRLLKPIAAIAFAALATHALAQGYPNRPIKLIAPYPPGGQTDITARAVATPLSQVLGVPVLVENKGGGGGVVGHDFVAKAPPDGYTLVVGNSAMLAVSVSVLKDLPFVPLRDFAPVTVVGGAPLVLEVNPKLPINNFADLIAYAKKNPGKLNFGLSTQGSIHHLLSEKIKKETGATWTYVPYKSNGQMITDLIAGQIDVTIDNIPSSVEYIRGGKLRPIAVSKKTDTLAGVPTLAESGLPVDDAWAWHSIAAPAGTPKPVIDKLNASLRQVLTRPDVVKQLNTLGLDVVANTPEEFAVFLREENERWAKVAREAGIKPIAGD